MDRRIGRWNRRREGIHTLHAPLGLVMTGVPSIDKTENRKIGAAAHPTGLAGDSEYSIDAVPAGRERRSGGHGCGKSPSLSCAKPQRRRHRLTARDCARGIEGTRKGPQELHMNEWTHNR